MQATVDTAHAVGLTGLLKITVPAEPGAPFTVAEKAGTWPVQRDAVSLDPYTGAITETVLWRDWPVMAKLTRIGILAHMGSLFGLVSQLALAAMALGLLSVLFWGYRMWWQRRPTRAGRVRLAPPVQRGNLRALSQPVVFAIVLAAVASAGCSPSSCRMRRCRASDDRARHRREPVTQPAERSWWPSGRPTRSATRSASGAKATPMTPQSRTWAPTEYRRNQYRRSASKPG